MKTHARTIGSGSDRHRDSNRQRESPTVTNSLIYPFFSADNLNCARKRHSSCHKILYIFYVNLYFLSHSVVVVEFAVSSSVLPTFTGAAVAVSTR